MDPNTINLIVSLISGLIGGNVAGAVMTEKNLGTIANSLSGLVGGGIGGWILKALGVLAATTAATHAGATPEHAASLDIGSLLASVGAGGAGGAALTGILGYLKDAFQKR